jgi:hypothetical protein
MDNHVRTGGLLARAYGFLFGHIVDVIGLGWLAAVFYGASVFLLIRRLMAALLIAPPATPLVNQFTLPYFAGFLIATAFFGAAMSVALTRNALGKLGSRAGVYFVYGRGEMRMFFALLRLYAIAVALTLATGFLAAKGAALAASQIPAGRMWLGAPPNLWLTAAAIFLTVCVFVLAQAWLGFFLAPLAAAGERALLRYSWQLSRGNSWATFAATFAMLLSVFGVLAGCYYFFSDSNFNTTMIAQRGDPAMWHAISDSAAAIAAICAIALTIMNGLFAGASASAYAAVESDLERIESSEPVHAMAATPRVEPGFFPRTGSETFAAAPMHAEMAAQPANVISEPVSIIAAEAPLETSDVEHFDVLEAPAEVAPAGEAVEDLTAEQGEDTAGETTPPPASSEVPPVSPEHAPSEAV